MKLYITFLGILLVCISCQEKKKEIEIKKENFSSNSKIFELVNSSQSNITFNNHIEENFENFFAVFNYVYNGAGVAVGDVNGDGLSDVYFVGNKVSNKLYLNKGNFEFEDITSSAGVSGGSGWHNGVVMADVNGDGLQDIYVCRGGYANDYSEVRSNLLFINQGDLTFKEEAEKYGLNDEGYSLMASFFDMDNDNDLDLYLTNRPNRFFMGYGQVLDGKRNSNNLFRDKLYVNNNGKFVEKGTESGITENFGYGLGLVTSDVNNDGNTDIMVSNDYLERDYLYVNQGNGFFKDELKERFNHIPFYAMGMDVVDFNNDGFEDIIQLEMMPEDYERSKTTMASMNTKLFDDMTSNGFHYQYMHNQFHLNRGDGIFSDISQYAGIAKTDWSWACLGADFDNDGFRDLYITNGFKRDIWDKDTNASFREYMRSPVFRKRTNEENAQYIINLFKENKISNYVFKNNGDLTFAKKTEEWGVNHSSFSNGASMADLDNDGDLDLIVNNINDEAFIYKNTSEKLKNSFLNIKLKGPEKNITGLGAKITLKHNNSIQYHQLKTVRGYLSSVDPVIHFGLGKADSVDEVQVLWPDGKLTVLNNVKSNQLIKVDYKESSIEESSIEESSIEESKNVEIKCLLTDITKKAFSKTFVHKENDFNDFKDQILLPHKLSQSGPCITVGDVNGDGLEDFYVGGAINQSGQLYFQSTNGTFKIKKANPFILDRKYEDVGAAFFDADGDNDLDLYVVSGGNEYDTSAEEYQDRLYINNGSGVYSKSNVLPNAKESGSCVVPFDFDGDGDMDLFVGGRLLPKTYPFAPKSYILENANGVFKDVTMEVMPEILNIGMVTSAVWSDIDGDKIMELLVVGEWMPISIFKKENRVYKNVTKRYGMNNTSGWWNKIVASDIDKDGDVDFIIGNLGLNYKFTASEKKPFIVYANDFDKNGTNDVFLAKHYKNREVPIRGKECTSQQMPEINKKFKTYQEFAKSNIIDVIGEKDNQTLRYEAKEFASVILENVNNELKMKYLPSEAQFSVINGVISQDFNDDGVNDLLIAGNKFETEVETTRADASIGSLMIGTNSKEYAPLNYLESGFYESGNVKEIKSINLANNKKGVLVGVNNGELKLYSVGN